MAIDYNTGISSLETGAPEIKYTGDEGPKSPDQELMAQADPMLVEEYKKYVFEMEEMEQQPMSFKQFLEQIMSRSQAEGRGGIQMASAADPLLQDEYDKYVFEMEEQGLQPISLEEFRQQAVAGMATGGRVPNIGPSGINSLNGWGSTDKKQEVAGANITASMDRDAGHKGWSTGHGADKTTQGKHGGWDTKKEHKAAKKAAKKPDPVETYIKGEAKKVPPFLLKKYLGKKAAEGWLPQYMMGSTLYDAGKWGLNKIKGQRSDLPPTAEGIDSLYTFKEDSPLDMELKLLNEDPSLNPDRYNQLLEQDVEQWDPEKGGDPAKNPLSLPANEYGQILYGADGGRAGYRDGYSVQGGVKNYLGDQEMVHAPKHWQSAPDHPQTELAYITDAEKDLLLKKDLHNSLSRGPNEGPEGLMSLNGGDPIGGYGPGGSWNGGNQGGNQGGPGGGRDASTVSFAKSAYAGQPEKFKQVVKTYGVRDDDSNKIIKDTSDPKVSGGPNEVQTGLGGGGKEEPTLIEEKEKKIGYKQKSSNYRKKELRKLFDYIYGGRKMQLPGWSSLFRKAEWEDDWYTNPTLFDQFSGEEFSAKDLQKLKDIQTALGQDYISQTGGLKGDDSFAFEDFYPNLNQQSSGGGDGWSPGVQHSGMPTTGDPITGDPTTAPKNWWDPSLFKKQVAQAPEKVTHDFSGIYADGGRAGYAGGGIADLRQAYGLGKLVKKITKGAKKALKNPIVRTALMAYGLRGMGGGGWDLGLGGWDKMGGAFMKSKPGAAWIKDNPALWDEGSTMGLAAWKDAVPWAQRLNPWTTIGIPSLVGGVSTYFDQEDEEKDEMYKKWLAEKTAADTHWIPRFDDSNFQRQRLYSADGGRIGYGSGSGTRNRMSELMIKLANGTITDEEMIELRNIESASGFSRANEAQGGRIGYAGGGYNDDEEEEGHRSAALSAMYKNRMGAQEGGLMDMGGMEKDYRNDGGFVPIGGQERADDVPARLSKNEFVFTADAVRAAGGGDIDAGAEVMENVMENLEKGGNVSEESQGLEGARDMFATSQRLEGVL